MRIDIWSDVVCPFCYLGKRHLELALADFEGAAGVEVRWHSFELDPAAEAVSSETVPQMLSRKYGISPDQVAQNNDRLQQQAAAVGLDYHLATARPGNTHTAHRLIHLAASEGLADALVERLMRAYFTETLAIGDTEVLARLATEVGLEPDRVRQVIASTEFDEQVAADIAQAAAYGATGVPFFVFDQAFAVSGAQPVEVFTRALEQAAARTASQIPAP